MRSRAPHPGRLPAASILSAVLLLASAAAAHANAFGDTFNDYKAHGRIEPCKHTAQELKQAKSQIPPDIEQYAPDFPAALDAALRARASGACAKGGTGAVPGGGTGAGPGGGGGGTTTGAPGPPGRGGSPVPPRGGSPRQPPGAPPVVRIHNSSRTGGAGSDTPAPLIVLAVLAALLALPALGWWLARWGGWEPAWLPGVRHTFAEASFRTANGWAEFTDWLRFGH